MRFFWGGILFVLGVGVLGTELRMLNGDQLQGEIVGVENGRLRFLPAWETTPLEIPAKYVGELLFASEESDLRKNAFDARIVLGNLDEFEADILEMDEEHARVRMPWGQMATLKRSYLSELHFHPPNLTPVFLDAGDPSKWLIPVVPNLNQHPVERKGNAIVVRARAGLSRELPPLPEKFIFEFTVVPPASVSNFHVGLARENVNHAPVINMIFMPGHFHFQARMEGGGQVIADNWQVQLPENPDEIRVRLRVDAGKSEFQLELNDSLVRQWRAEGMTLKSVLKNGAILVSYQHGNEPLTLKGFRIQEWSGNVERRDPPGDFRLKNTDQDFLLLLNGDLLPGKVLSISETHVNLQLNEMVIPVDRKRLRALYFAPARVSVGRKQARDVEIRNSIGFTRLTLALRDLDASRFRGESDAWVEILEIPGNDVGYLRFNPYLRFRNEPTDPMRDMGD